MFINCKKNVEISDGKQKYAIPRAYIGEIPKWVESDWYFKALCKDGTITAIVSSKDKAVEDAEAKAKAAAERAAAEAAKKAAADEAKAKKAAEEEAKAKAAAGGGNT